MYFMRIPNLVSYVQAHDKHRVVLESDTYGQGPDTPPFNLFPPSDALDCFWWLLMTIFQAIWVAPCLYLYVIVFRFTLPLFSLSTPLSSGVSITLCSSVERKNLDSLS